MFITFVYRMYGAPETVVSDRGPQFVSEFWNEVCKALGVKVKLSTANHAQTDGQTEIVNQYIDQRLRPYVNQNQDNWDLLLPIIDFAQSMLPHASTGLSPIFTELGYEPKVSFDWRAVVKEAASKQVKLARREGNEFVKGLHDAWKFARTNMAKAQESMAAQANKKRRPVDIQAGDHVWVTTKHWKTHQPSRKLGPQMAGPFKVKEVWGNAVTVELPDSIQVHPKLNVSKVRKADMDPLPGQANPEPEPIEVDGEHEYEVEEVLSVRKVRKKLFYRVSWRGWDVDLDEYPASDLKHAPQALKDFHEANPGMPGPPMHLEYWLRCAANDEVVEDRRGDDWEED